MIFISGVHGVGKSFFCNLLKERLGLISYSESKLISDRKKIGFAPDKLVGDIDENQLYLQEAVNNLRSSGERFLLDGHFCLLNQEGVITRIPLSTFKMLAPDAIVLLTEEPVIIAERRQERDGVKYSAAEIKVFQDEEIKYAMEVAEFLNVPIKVSSSSNIEDMIDFICTRRG